MLMNSLDPMLEECPEFLIAYGCTGKGVKARNGRQWPRLCSRQVRIVNC